MSTMYTRLTIPLAVIGFFLSTPAEADSFFFSTGNPDGLIGTASRPASAGKVEIELADDFVLTGETAITSATFTGLLPIGAPLSDVKDVAVEIYRVFPNDSDTVRTPNVTTRVNSPSDVELADRDSASGGLTFTPGVIQSSFTANKSVLNGINPLNPDPPGEFTGGELAVTGQEVEFSVLFATPFVLPADHYFFVPQVELTNGDFFWLSAPRPIVPPGTPFPPGFTDLQSWIRNGPLDPDWLRIGTDITHQVPFNAAFTLSGSAVPEPSTWAMMILGFAGLGFAGYRRARRSRAAFAA